MSLADGAQNPQPGLAWINRPNISDLSTQRSAVSGEIWNELTVGWRKHKPRTYEIIFWYLRDMAGEQDLLPHIDRQKRQPRFSRAAVQRALRQTSRCANCAETVKIVAWNGPAQRPSIWATTSRGHNFNE